jgi:hypothetical protein
VDKIAPLKSAPEKSVFCNKAPLRFADIKFCPRLLHPDQFIPGAAGASQSGVVLVFATILPDRITVMIATVDKFFSFIISSLKAKYINYIQSSYYDKTISNVKFFMAFSNIGGLT